MSLDNQQHDEEQRARYPDSKRRDSIQQGMRYQDFICDRLAVASPPIIIQNYCSELWQRKAENRQNIELKNDEGLHKFGHLAIEDAKRNSFAGPWFKSGIAKPSLFYLQGNYNEAFLFRTAVLRAYVLKASPKMIDDNPSTVRKFYLGLHEARRLAERVFDFHDDGSVTG